MPKSKDQSSVKSSGDGRSRPSSSGRPSSSRGKPGGRAGSKKTQASGPRPPGTRLENVVARNIMVHSLYRKLLMQAVLATVAAALMLFITLSVFGRKVPPQYVPVTVDGAILPLPPVAEPSLDDSRVFSFSLDALRAINTYDYINYASQIQDAQFYFTVGAWNAYKDRFMQTSVLNAVSRRKMIVSVRPTGPARIVSKGVEDGVYRWYVEVPAIITYTAHADGSGSGSNVQEGLAKFAISRVPATLDPRGVLLDDYGFTLVKR